MRPVPSAACRGPRSDAGRGEGRGGARRRRDRRNGAEAPVVGERTGERAKWRARRTWAPASWPRTPRGRREHRQRTADKRRIEWTRSGLGRTPYRRAACRRRFLPASGCRRRSSAGFSAAPSSPPPSSAPSSGGACGDGLCGTRDAAPRHSGEICGVVRVGGHSPQRPGRSVRRGRLGSGPALRRAGLVPRGADGS